MVRQRFGDDVQNLWKSIHMVCIQKICPKILRDHFAVQASSIDSLEKQTLTIEKILQANVHGSGATPMDVDALAKTKGGKKGGKGKERRQVKEVRRQLYGHMMEDCQKEGSWETASSQVPARTRSEIEGQRLRWQRQEGSVVP